MVLTLTTNLKGADFVQVYNENFEETSDPSSSGYKQVRAIS